MTSTACPFIEPYVADSLNNRVLEYNGPFGNGQTDDVTADLVFGQGAAGDVFNTKSCATTQTGLCRPEGVAINAGGNLYVADLTNNRVLEYNGPFGNGAINDVTADGVYGQGASGSSFTTNTCANGVAPVPAPSAIGMCQPNGVALDGGTLYVSDGGNERTLVFDTALSNFTANLELGQTDFLHNMTNFGGALAETSPADVAVDRNSTPKHLYVSDTANNRVLGYRDVTAFLSGGLADIVLGQPDFFTSLQNGSLNTVSATTLAAPLGLAVDQNHNLAVADSGNSRVLIFPNPFTYSGSTPEPATVVFGQGTATNFTGNACNQPPGATDLCFPGAVAFDATGNLFVADTQNSRVLEYNTPLAPTNVTANLVFGQGASGNSFSTFICADDIGDHPPVSATGLCLPDGVALDVSGDLFVADGINRVLEYNGPFGAMQTNDVTADLVFGQGTVGTNFSGHACANGSNAPAPSSTGICYVAGLSIDPSGNLYVADLQNNRVLEFSPPFGTNNVTASTVFGQGSGGTSFSTNVCAGGASSAPGSAGAAGLCQPQGVDLDAGGDLLIADTANNRVAVY
ncbi:MAG: hypothetical protein ACLPSW_33775, partial [Roseiarcus sp.]